MRVRLSVLASFFAVVSIVSVSFAQSPASTLQASTVIQQVRQALLGSVGVADLTLTGTAVRTAGSDTEEGNFTLRGLGSDQSRFDLAISGGTRTEVFTTSDLSGVQGRWADKDGVFHAMAEHNSAAGMTWFAPSLAIGARLGSPDVVASYLGQGTKNDQSVHHLRLTTVYPGASAVHAQTLSSLSAMDFYVDTSTSLPIALAYNVHPDNDLRVDIPIEVDFSDYRAVQGVPIPFHIQKYMNGTLLLDLTVEHAVVNSGLTNSAFETN